MSKPRKPGETDAEDDGWGEAADELGPRAPAKPAAPAKVEWKDPANLDERVAALRAGETPQPAANVETQAPPEPEQQAAPEQEPAAESERPAEGTPPAEDEAVEDEAVEEQASAATHDIAAVPPQPVSDEDAPHWAPPAVPDKPADEQPLPAPSSDMLAAAGVIAKKNADPKAKKKRRPPKEPRQGLGLTRKQTIKVIAGAVVLVLAGVGAILGWLNSKHYYLVCGTKSISAQQGRFWPWGRDPLPGPEFRAITVPTDVLCQSQHYDNRAELETAFLTSLLEQSTNLLATGGAEQVDVAEAQLEQALLLTREPERSEQRELAERLQGDVSYWRGAAEVQRAAEVLKAAAQSFEEAAAKRPRHSSDASAWGQHAHFIAEEIDKGPRSLRADEKPKEKPHFGGLTTPGPPAAPEKTPPTTSPVVPDAGVETEPPADADVPPTDAALPRGGVLL